MIHYLILCTLLAIVLIAMVLVAATGLMLTAIRRDQEWRTQNDNGKDGADTTAHQAK